MGYEWLKMGLFGQLPETILPFDQIINGVDWDGQTMRQIQLMAS